MTSTRWWQYIEPVISGMTMRDAAKKAGFNQSAFTRWKKGAKADPDFVVKFARAFSLNVLEALAEAELITEDEANLREVTVDGPALSDATNEQLTDEVLRRLREGSQAFDEPVDELAERRSNTQSAPADTHDGTVTEWDGSKPAAADSSPDENEERIKRGEDPID